MENRAATMGGHFRGVSVWIGAAIAGSFGCTAAWSFILGGGITPYDLRVIVALALTTMFWTIPGSAFVTLAFAWTGGRSIAVPMRYALVIVLGAVAGTLVMLPFGGSSSLLAGCSFGASTALCWVVLHRLLYG